MDALDHASVVEFVLKSRLMVCVVAISTQTYNFPCTLCQTHSVSSRREAYVKLVCANHLKT